MGQKNFLKTFVLGENFLEIVCPRAKIFIPWDKNFLKIFILGHFFSRTKIPVTGRSLAMRKVRNYCGGASLHGLTCCLIELVFLTFSSHATSIIRTSRSNRKTPENRAHR